LLNLRQYKEARRISVYLSMPVGEIQTDEIVRHALSSGKDVFVPYLHKNEGTRKEDDEPVPKKVMDMVKLKGLEDFEGLERDSWGIPTVTEDIVEGRERILMDSSKYGEVKKVKGLDLILMPGVAFSVEGQQAIVRRLGHGKGFYDYFLHRYRRLDHLEGIEKNPGIAVELWGLALKEQIVDKDTSVPVGPYDSSLDGLIVGNGEALKSTISISN
jgi:5-formyltetrahydrofolate cyclo-ligase